MKNIVQFCAVILFIFQFTFCSIDKNKFCQSPKIIIFEIEDTLIELDYFKVSYDYFGLFQIAKSSFSSESINQFYINTLYRISPNSKRSFYSNAIPPLQKEFLIGNKTSQECLNIIDNWINKNPSQFENDSQKQIFRKIAHLNFDPNIYFRYQKETKAIDLMRKLYDCRDKDYKRTNIIVITSNQAKESISILKSKFPKIFQYSDAQFFSYQHKCLKFNAELIENAISAIPIKTYYLGAYVDNNNEFNQKLKTFSLIKSHKIHSTNVNEAKNLLLEIGAL